MATFTVAAETARDRALKSLASLPPFSPVLNRLLASLSSDDVSIQSVSAIVEKDAVIAGNILKLVNSAMYGRRGVVTSISHAAMLLGLFRLRNAVLGMSIARVWSSVKTPPSWSMARFNLHSVATALLADQLAQRSPVEFGEGAFLAGLFHDLGKMLIAVGSPALYDDVLRLAAETSVPLYECEEQILGVNHAELSALALTKWGMPQAIRTAVLKHHAADTGTSEVRLGMFPLAAVVRNADLYVGSSGVTVEKVPPAYKPEPSDPFTSMGLERHMPEILEEFQAQYNALSAFFR